MESENDGARIQALTVERLQSSMRTSFFVAMPEVIRLVQSLSSRAFAFTVDELGAIIAQDPAMAVRVIGSANTVGNNPTGQPVCTVGQSIQLIGFERVRHLAISLLSSGGDIPLPEEEHEAAAFSLFSGLFAQELAQQGFADGEMAFTCTSLRSYGRILMAAFMTEEFRQAQDLFEEMGEDQAFREVFGLSPLEATAALLAHSAIPRDLMKTFQKASPMLARVPTNRADDELIVLGDFSVRFCDLLTDATLDRDLFRGRMENLVSGYNAAYRLTPESVTDALASAVTHLDLFDKRFELERPGSAMLRMAAARARGEDPPPDLEIAFIAGRHRAAERRLARARLVLEAKRQDFEILDDAVSAASGMTPGSPELAQSLAEAMARAMKLDAVLVLRTSGDGFVNAALAGELSSSLRMAGMQIDAGLRDVFGVALNRREDVLVADVRRGNIARYLPMWLKLNAPVMSLLILPVVDSGKVEGLVFGVRGRGRPLETSSRVLSSLRQIKAALLLSWKGPGNETIPLASEVPEWLPPRNPGASEEPRG